MDVTESDHKPVRCKFHVEIAHVDRSVRRQEFGKIFLSNDKIRGLREELHYVPETAISTNNIVLQNQDTCSLKITNKNGNDKVIFQIVCEGQSTINEDEQARITVREVPLDFPVGLSYLLDVPSHSHLSSGRHTQLDNDLPNGQLICEKCNIQEIVNKVTPAAGIIKPDQVAEVLVHHEDFRTLEEFVDGIPQSWWSEDTRDKEVVLLVNVRGSCSTQTRTHRVHVRHCFATKTVRIDSKSSSSRKHQGSSHQRPALRHMGSASDMADDHRDLHGL
ncbi:unnamed protein product [Ilex paraguariensis]|uniref:IP5PC-F immunoglobulin-like domain-containing protein n=1 Tax=Ilex paraguariensis TaxID=185542 RepID=A0ABC8S3N4_9AQUA